MLNDFSISIGILVAVVMVVLIGVCVGDACNEHKWLDVRHVVAVVAIVGVVAIVAVIVVVNADDDVVANKSVAICLSYFDLIENRGGLSLALIEDEVVVATFSLFVSFCKSCTFQLLQLGVCSHCSNKVFSTTTLCDNSITFCIFECSVTCFTHIKADQASKTQPTVPSPPQQITLKFGKSLNRRPI
uniref:Uncharacterized protein n=1 Tax=Glossina brevipalpis TaxID=37001 RepID=A0A1A9W6Z8_9MUSC